MSYISKIDPETADEKEKEVIRNHLAQGYRLTNEKLTLLHNAEAFKAIEDSSYTLDRELQRLIGNMRDYRAKLDRVIAHEKHRARGESAKIEIVNSPPFIIKEIDTNMDEAMESFPS